MELTVKLPRRFPRAWLRLVQFIALVHAPAAEVFEGLYNPDERHKWDTYVTHGKVVEDRKGSSNTQVPLEDFSPQPLR